MGGMDGGSAGIWQAERLMQRFAERTGLASDRPPRRYLWTDAFAVCNFLALAAATGDPRHLERARRLTDQVHRVLGRYRPDDSRSGWLSGLGDAEAALHPTRGGLRIGKPLPEREPGEPFDPRLEWERDGQYFHYLTKWMLALDQLARFTEEPRFNLWARELAEAAYHSFSRPGARPGRRTLAWKMSTDLSWPLVSSMGQHDPLDGFITYEGLRVTARALNTEPGAPTLDDALEGLGALVAEGEWVTADPLGLGGLLMDGARGLQLALAGGQVSPRHLFAILAAALTGLRHYASRTELVAPAWRRLAFRELGLAIGLHAVAVMKDLLIRTPDFPEGQGGGGDLRVLVDAFGPYVPLAVAIESFWLDPDHRQQEPFVEHLDINEVMLATSVLPRGSLVLFPYHQGQPGSHACG